MLKELKLHPYKPRLLHELADKNFAHRMAFCEERNKRLDDDPDFINQMKFKTKRIFIFPAMLTGTICVIGRMKIPTSLSRIRYTHHVSPYGLVSGPEKSSAQLFSMTQ